MIPSTMAERFEDAARMLKDVRKVRVISHYDADGIFSAAILSKALLREGIDFHITLWKSLDEPIVGRVIEERNPAVIICDIGSGEIELAERLGSNVVLLDHHQIQKESSQIIQINPHLFEMDGADVLCGSMLSFLLGVAMNERNWELVPLALAGAIADKQHLNGLKGANASILKEAVERGEIRVERRMLIEGKIGEAIANSIEPYFCLSSEELARHLQELGIDPSARVEELDDGSNRQLISILSLKLVGQGAHSEAIESLIGDAYFSKGAKATVNSLSDDVNACGRMRQEALGIELCYDDQEARTKVDQLRKEYEERIRTELGNIRSEGLFEKENLQFFYSEDGKIAGAVAGIAMQYFLNQEKATFALCVLEKKTKISARATKYLVAKGLNLASVCNAAASNVGGRGGGHTIAAGAVVPRGKEERFLEHADDLISAQYNDSKTDEGYDNGPNADSERRASNKKQQVLL